MSDLVGSNRPSGGTTDGYPCDAKYAPLPVFAPQTETWLNRNSRQQKVRPHIFFGPGCTILNLPSKKHCPQKNIDVKRKSSVGCVPLSSPMSHIMRHEGIA